MKKVDLPKMADLPKDRMSEEPPFTYCGINLSGPFLVKDGRKEVKRYGERDIMYCISRIHLCIPRDGSHQDHKFLGRKWW